MNIWQLFSRRADGRAIPFDATTYQAELEARLAVRRQNRPHRSQAALKGAATKRRAGN